MNRFLHGGGVNSDLSLGRRGELAAEQLLRAKGYKIIAHGEKDQLGEIDLIAVDGRIVVFIEVKTRSSEYHGHPADQVDEQKQRQLTRAALRFRSRRGLLEEAGRFDVIAVWWPADAPEPNHIEHYINAFEPVGTGRWFD